ncbi:MAG: glycosyltransferase family 2 protein [Gammaproteobacteria bacterium]|jgi:glycosyltransferase involved in cell wall biosynthesis|nr:glycosyltransferase family 2 protein [Gammaproteobacteria bacterium]
MSVNPRIAILLATYNGSKYLAEQLDSILNQSYENFVIVVRDDGSSDDTVALLKNYAVRQADKFHLLDDDSTNRGASGSFSFLIEYVLQNKQALGLADAYMMFCDQDDIWYEDKIEKQVAVMLDVERDDVGAEACPVLIHSDLQVVSEQKSVIASSLVRYQGLEIDRNRFPNLVISNLVTGCTALINETLALKAVPVSKQAIMHDWWLALVASAFGKLIFLDTPLVHYRQHSSNTIGAKEFIKPTPLHRSFWQKLVSRQPNEHLFEVARQAADFRHRFGKYLSVRDNIGLRISSCMSARIGVLQRVFYRVARRF